MKVLARVPSLTDETKKYAITLHADGIGCECIAFSYSPASDKGCKHTAIYKAAQHALARCFDAGHEDGTRLCGQCLVELLAVAQRKVKRKYVPVERVEQIREQAKAKVHDIRERFKQRKRR